MATTPQPVIFDAKGAERFAALWAGFDTNNPSEAEAMGKGRALRRMAMEQNLRVIDALELPEIRKAIDDQLQPSRLPVPDVAALQAENEELRGKLSLIIPKVQELADILTQERKDFVEIGISFVVSGGIDLLAFTKFGLVGGITAGVLELLFVFVIFNKE